MPSVCSPDHACTGGIGATRCAGIGPSFWRLDRRTNSTICPGSLRLRTAHDREVGGARGRDDRSAGGVGLAADQCALGDRGAGYATGSLEREAGKTRRHAVRRGYPPEAVLERRFLTYTRSRLIVGSGQRRLARGERSGVYPPTGQCFVLTALLPAWSPERRKIVFVSNRDGNFEVYVMNAGEVVPTWSPRRAN
jgi:WD40 repeat protein